MPNAAPAPKVDASVLEAIRASTVRVAMACFRDDEGNPIAAMPHHRLMVMVMEADYLGFTVINAPPGFAKSWWVDFFLSRRLALNPDERVIYVSKSEQLARKQSLMLRDTFDQNPYFRLIFPNAVPNKTKGWGVDQWFLKRSNLNDPNPSFAAYGIDGMVVGSRADLIVFDDINDQKQIRSETQRQQVVDWISNTARSRLTPKSGRIINIQCMTGDTPVRMADGSERPLRDIRPGDHISTYDSGKLSVSVVQNHTSQGKDEIFRITTDSGRTVRANRRHPFLVEDCGYWRWMRLQDLTTDHRIVALRDKKASGRAACASAMGVESPSFAGDFACPTIKKRSGLTDIALPRSMRQRTDADTLNTATALLLKSMRLSCSHRTESAPFVSSLRAKTIQRTGAVNCASITATTRELFADCSVTTATSQSATPKQQQPLPQWSNTSDFTTERIISIEPAGIEEVFDVQVADTENFLANGLVSHNTRWHEEDATGWCLKEHWTQLRLQALADNDGPEQWATLTVWSKLKADRLAKDLDRDGWRFQAEELGSDEGKDRRWEFRIFLHANGPSLWPERFVCGSDLDTDLFRIRLSQSPQDWACTYQSLPVPEGGAIIPVDALQSYPWADRSFRQQDWTIKVQAWDTAFGKNTLGDFSVCLTWGLHRNGSMWLLDMFRERIPFPALKLKVLDLFTTHAPNIVVIEDAASGTSLIQEFKNPDSSRLFRVPVLAVPPKTYGTDKVSRVHSITGYIAASKVWVPKDAPWSADLINELAMFPNGRHDDIVDAFVLGIRQLLKSVLATAIAEQPGETGSFFGNILDADYIFSDPDDLW